MTDHAGTAAHSIDRRGFISASGSAMAVLAGLPGLVGSAGATSPDATRQRLARTALNGHEFDEVSLSELANGMKEGRWTSSSLVRWYLDAIDRIDREGPEINAVLEVNPDAMSIAAALDAERASKGPRGPLHGIPVLLKDNIETADRLHTSAGSLALADHFAAKDAFVVTKLRAAGCVILGKANMSEWANARGRASVGGWSGRGRLTRNPYVLDRSAGGSSSGAAAAVSANLTAVAVGTETMGSIVTPSSLCGIVGMKPTVGLVSRSGIIPVSYTQDTAGPMCRSVRDAATLLNALAGPDPADAQTASAAGHIPPDYTSFLDPGALRGARIGVARNLFGTSLVADRVIERSLEAMRTAGANLVDPADIETAEGIWTFDSEVLSYELKASLDAYLHALPASSPVHSLKELIAFNVRNSDRELDWFGQETFEYAEQKGPLTSPQYVKSLQVVRQLARTQGIDATIAKYKLDAIVAPAASPAWLTDVLLGDNTILGSFVAPAAAGYPSISVPAGDVLGLPVGILFMGPAWSEGPLLKLAFAFEQLLRARRAPTFQQTIDVRP